MAFHKVNWKLSLRRVIADKQLKSWKNKIQTGTPVTSAESLKKMYLIEAFNKLHVLVESAVVPIIPPAVLNCAGGQEKSI